MTFYRISRLAGRVQRPSMTEPIRGTLDVVLKQDGENAPCCVYNEIVALRLAQRIGVPLAMGVPSVGDGGMYFASLVVGGLSINLPDVTRRKMAGVAKRYPSEAAALFVFDVWIHNDDRAENLKANLTANPLPLVAGIDQEKSLLSCAGDLPDSLKALTANRAPTRHPFKGHLEANRIMEWQRATQSVSDEAIDTAIVLGYSVGGVHRASQMLLAQVMKARRDALPELLALAQR